MKDEFKSPIELGRPNLGRGKVKGLTTDGRQLTTDSF